MKMRKRVVVLSSFPGLIRIAVCLDHLSVNVACAIGVG